MKATDDYNAKLKFWALEQKVIPEPPLPPLPPFTPKKFRSHEEMNRWKEEYLREIARASLPNSE